MVQLIWPARLLPFVCLRSQTDPPQTCCSSLTTSRNGNLCLIAQSCTTFPNRGGGCICRIVCYYIMDETESEGLRCRKYKSLIMITSKFVRVKNKQMRHWVKQCKYLTISGDNPIDFNRSLKGAKLYKVHFTSVF